jgi:hypothetical protein
MKTHKCVCVCVCVCASDWAAAAGGLAYTTSSTSDASKQMTIHNVADGSIKYTYILLGLGHRLSLQLKLN